MKNREVVQCFENCCNKCNQKSISKLLVAPFEINNLQVKRLLSYFLHLAPNIESTHSIKIDKDKHNEIFSRMFENRRFKYAKFCASNAKIDNELLKGYLYGDLICLKCKRYVCKKKKGKINQEETDLECFLRHIRNAIAHGRVYYCHAGNRVHIIFEDMNDKGSISARIVCIKADLLFWKRILTENYYS